MTVVTNYHKLGSLKLKVTSQKLVAWGSSQGVTRTELAGEALGRARSSPPVGFGAVTCWALSFPLRSRFWSQCLSSPPPLDGVQDVCAGPTQPSSF